MKVRMYSWANRIFLSIFLVASVCQCQLLARHLVKRQVITGPPAGSYCGAPSALLYAWSSDCTQFSQCGSGGILAVRSCGPGTLFNPATMVCDWPYNVPQPCSVSGSSGSSGTTAPTSAPTVAPSGGVITGPAQGSYCGAPSAMLYAWSSDCTQFSQCGSGGTLVVRSCGPGTLFNPATMVCDWPYNVPQPCSVSGSSGGSGTTAPTSAPTAAPTSAPTAAPSGGVITGPAPGSYCGAPSAMLYAWSSDCKQFSQCGSGGILAVRSCGTGTLFNPATMVCDWPYNVPQPCSVSGSSGGSGTTAPTSAPTTASTTTPNSFPNCFLALSPTDRTTYCADSNFKSTFPECCP